MKPTLYPNGFPSAYEELKTFYPVFYRDVFEMDAIWRAAGGGLDEIEDGVDAVVNNNFVSLMDTDALAQMETFLGIPLNQKRTLEARRKLVASYFIGGNHIGAREIKDITRAFTEGTCEVSFVGGTVYIHVKSDIKDTPPEDDYYYILRKKIPAHLGVYTNIEIEFSERLYNFKWYGKLRHCPPATCRPERSRRAAHRQLYHAERQDWHRPASAARPLV